MNKRPAVKLRLTKTDVNLEVVALAMLISFWGYIMIIYDSLPGIIPVHFSASGKPDGYGNKNYLYELPKVATILYILLSVATLFSRYFNYLVKITAQNAEAQYKNANRGLRILKISVLTIFLAVTIATTQFIRDFNMKSILFLFMGNMALILLPTFYFAVKSVSLKNKS